MRGLRCAAELVVRIVKRILSVTVVANLLLPRASLRDSARQLLTMWMNSGLRKVGKGLKVSVHQEMKEKHVQE